MEPCIITFAVGIVLGIILALVACKIKRIGTLRVDSSDPYEQPYLFLELKKDVGNLQHKKYVLVEVNLENYISQK